jgi:hypothetical protein
MENFLINKKKYERSEDLLKQISLFKDMNQLIQLLYNNKGLRLDKYISTIVKQVVKTSQNHSGDSIFNFLNLIKNDQEKIKTDMCDFYANLFFCLKNEKEVMKNIIGIGENLNYINTLFLKISNKIKKNKLILTRECQVDCRLMILDIHSKFIPYFIDTFKLMDLLFEGNFLSNQINTKCRNKKNLAEKEFIQIFELIKIIEYQSKKPSEDLFNKFLQSLDYKALIKQFFNGPREEKKYNSGLLKTILYYNPNETYELVNYLISTNETKISNELIKENKLSQYITREQMQKVELQSKKKAFNYHYNQRWKKFEMELEALVDLFWNDHEILTELANTLVRDNYLSECFYLLHRYNFNSNLIILEKEQRKYLCEQLEQLFSNSLNKKELAKYYKNCVNKSNIHTDYEYMKLFSNVSKVNIFFPDYFGPYDNTCLTLQLSQSDIKFINSVDDLNILQRVEDNYIGVDCEWKPKNTANEEDSISIMQIAFKSGVVILDIHTLKNNEIFLKQLSEFFSNKTIIGFSFSNDLKTMDSKLREIVRTCKCIDMSLLYNSKKNTPSLANMCMDILNKPLCKKEQMSNWDIRPLRMKQLHYAALDAYVLLLLHESFEKAKITEVTEVTEVADITNTDSDDK